MLLGRARKQRRVSTSRCPTCGGKVPRKPVGRPKLQIPVQNVLNALREGGSVTSVALRFGISRASVYRMSDEYDRNGKDGPRR